MKEKGRSDAHRVNCTLALHSRRKFLKKALLTAAYVAPAITSYPSTVFATHQCGMPPMGGVEMCMGMDFTPGCSPL
jgi:hypothetical protein